MTARRATALAAALALSHAAGAQAQDSRQVAEPKLPQACAVLAAVAGGGNDAPRIQAALDRCQPGQAVRLAAGGEQRAFTSGPLVLKNGVGLLIDEGVTLHASREPKLFDRGAGTCGAIDTGGKGCRPLIAIDKVRGAGIYGSGTIDGQGGRVLQGGSESWWQLARRAQKENARQNAPRLVDITKAQDITLYGVTLRDSPNFHVALNGVDGFTAWGVKIDTPPSARNTDGIDPISSRNVTIAHSFIRTGDDNVAIKAGNSGPTENVTVRDSHFYGGHGMSIGSETNGGLRRVLVENLTVDGATSGLRIKSDVSRGGTVDGVTYRNVCLRNNKTPIDITSDYARDARGKLVPSYANLLFDGVRSTTPGQVVVQGFDAAHPVGATLRNVAVPGRQQLAHAVIEGRWDSVAAPDCEGRFVPFPVTGEPRIRPQLPTDARKKLSMLEVLKTTGRAGSEITDPWDPLADPLAKGAAFKADYIVDAGAKADGVKLFATVQAAVSRAVTDSAARPERRERLYILVKPGSYRELVYVPASNRPITLYGEGKSAQDTVITAGLDAAVAPGDYARQFGAQFDNADPAIRAMHALVRERTGNISTSGSMTMWVRNHGFQARNLTIENSYNKATGNAREECGERACGNNAPDAQASKVHHQAVALTVEGADKAQFENVRLIGFQDTLYLKSAETRVTARSFFHRAYIEGDVDFIFGDTTAYFYRSEIKSLGDRSTSYVGAPNTNWRTKYGLVFDTCRFTNDGSPNALAGKFYLARQWFHNSRCSPYAPVDVEGYACVLGSESVYRKPKGTITPTVLETVGKMLVVNSTIGRHIDRARPWSDWNRPGTLAYRPAQFTSSDFWTNLGKAGFDPVKDLGYTAAPAPADIYLAEFNNADE